MRSRIATLMCVLVVGPRASAQDVYETKGERGRPLFTNAGDMTVSGSSPEPVALPPLPSVDFAASPPAALSSIDARVERAHRTLSEGHRCQALRDGAGRSWGDMFWHDHATDLAWMLGLLGMSWALARGLRRHPLRLAFSSLPLCAAGAFGAFSVQTVQAARSALADGVAACAEPLPRGDASRPDDVQRRYRHVLDLQQRVDSAYARQERQIAAIFEEARR